MKFTSKPDTQTHLAHVVLLSFAYAFTGKLALMLAIAPGYATAIFPSAGIAVTSLLLWGNRLWAGVFLGSLSLNVWTGAEQGTITAPGLQVAFSIAVGASLQALAGAWLVRRVVGFPTPLTKEMDILKFMLAAGPIACLVNATFGATALYATGVIPLTAYGFSWFTWWVGDSIGVLIGAPLMFVAFAHPRDLWRSRRTVVIVPLFTALVSVIVLFYMASQKEQERIDSNFERIASDVDEKMHRSFNAYLDSVAYIERFISSSTQVSRNNFHSFVAFSLDKNPGIQALSWNPVVEDRHREKFEMEVRNEGFPEYQITERDSSKKLIRASKRAEYVAVQYIEPMQGNETAFGFDVASNLERRNTLHQARDLGRAIATPPIILVQDRKEQTGFLLFQPVYHGTPRTVDERKNSLRGFAVGVFRIGDIVESALAPQHREEINMSIHEAGDQQARILYGVEHQGASILFESQLDIGGRQWIIKYWPTPAYQAKQNTWQAWGVLATGLLLVSLLGAFLLAMTGHAHHVEGMVAHRTAELRGILSAAMDAILTLNANGCIENVNPAGESLFAYSADELNGTSILTVIPDFFVELAPDLATSTAASRVGSRRDTCAIRKDGRKVPIELAISTAMIGDRKIISVTAHDISERQKIDRMKDEFISTVSHELRTPLTSISGALGLITGGALDNAPDKIKSVLTIAYENSTRLSKLVDDLLTFQKSRLSEIPLTLETISANTLVDRAIAANQGYATKYGLRIAWTPNKEDACIKVDEARLIQVLSNILSNAFKYSPRDGQVGVEVTHDTTTVRISVSDSGPGIPVEFQDKVFEKFSQADSSDTRQRGGTGLGMAISKSLVEQHGGRISFVSQPGRGTTFHVDLPVADQAAA